MLPPAKQFYSGPADRHDSASKVVLRPAAGPAIVPQAAAACKKAAGSGPAELHDSTSKAVLRPAAAMPRPADPAPPADMILPGKQD